MGIGNQNNSLSNLTHNTIAEPTLSSQLPLNSKQEAAPFLLAFAGSKTFGGSSGGGTIRIPKLPKGHNKLQTFPGMENKIYQMTQGQFKKLTGTLPASMPVQRFAGSGRLIRPNNAQLYQQGMLRFVVPVGLNAEQLSNRTYVSLAPDMGGALMYLTHQAAMARYPNGVQSGDLASAPLVGKYFTMQQYVQLLDLENRLNAGAGGPVGRRYQVMLDTLEKAYIQLVNDVLQMPPTQPKIVDAVNGINTMGNAALQQGTTLVDRLGEQASGVINDAQQRLGQVLNPQSAEVSASSGVPIEQLYPEVRVLEGNATVEHNGQSVSVPLQVANVDPQGAQGIAKPFQLRYTHPTHGPQSVPLHSTDHGSAYHEAVGIVQQAWNASAGATSAVTGSVPISRAAAIDHILGDNTGVYREALKNALLRRVEGMSGPEILAFNNRLLTSPVTVNAIHTEAQTELWNQGVNTAAQVVQAQDPSISNNKATEVIEQALTKAGINSWQGAKRYARNLPSSPKEVQQLASKATNNPSSADTAQNTPAPEVAPTASKTNSANQTQQTNRVGQAQTIRLANHNAKLTLTPMQQGGTPFFVAQLEVNDQTHSKYIHTNSQNSAQQQAVDWSSKLFNSSAQPTIQKPANTMNNRSDAKTDDLVKIGLIPKEAQEERQRRENYNWNFQTATPIDPESLNHEHARMAATAEASHAGNAPLDIIGTVHIHDTEIAKWSEAWHKWRSENPEKANKLLKELRGTPFAKPGVNTGAVIMKYINHLQQEFDINMAPEELPAALAPPQGSNTIEVELAVPANSNEVIKIRIIINNPSKESAPQSSDLNNLADEMSQILARGERIPPSLLNRYLTQDEESAASQSDQEMGFATAPMEGSSSTDSINQYELRMLLGEVLTNPTATNPLHSQKPNLVIVDNFMLGDEPIDKNHPAVKKFTASMPVDNYLSRSFLAAFLNELNTENVESRFTLLWEVIKSIMSPQQQEFYANTTIDSYFNPSSTSNIGQLYLLIDSILIKLGRLGDLPISPLEFLIALQPKSKQLAIESLIESLQNNGINDEIIQQTIRKYNRFIEIGLQTLQKNHTHKRNVSEKFNHLFKNNISRELLNFIWDTVIQQPGVYDFGTSTKLCDICVQQLSTLLFNSGYTIEAVGDKQHYVVRLFAKNKITYIDTAWLQWIEPQLRDNAPPIIAGDRDQLKAIYKIYKPLLSDTELDDFLNEIYFSKTRIYSNSVSHSSPSQIEQKPSEEGDKLTNSEQ